MLSSRGVKAFIERKFYNFSERYRQNDERWTDIMTDSRGFGNDLLALLKYEEQRGEDKDGETHEGLTAEELNRILADS